MELRGAQEILRLIECELTIRAEGRPSLFIGEKPSLGWTERGETEMMKTWVWILPRDPRGSMSRNDGMSCRCFNRNPYLR